jgi:hypothetical protein
VAYALPVMIHVAAGGAAILSGFAAVAASKGSRPHRLAGNVFFVSMLTMAGFAAVMALLAMQRANTLAAVFTLYLVGTAWTVVRNRPQTVGRFEAFAPLAALAVVVFGFDLGVQASTVGIQDGDPSSGDSPGIYFMFATIAALAGAMDLRMLRRGGLAGADRLSRHLWRMCLALFVAAGSFFLGQADEIPARFRGAHLSIPPLAALAALAFWMVRVRIRPRRARAAPSPA